MSSSSSRWARRSGSTFSVTAACQSRCKTCNIGALYLANPKLAEQNLSLEEIVETRNYSLAAAARPALGEYAVWFTVILAMLPAAFGVGAGSDTNGPLAVTVIGGMISSTLLTLVVVPAVYSLVENGLLRLRARRAARQPAAA